MPAHNLNAALEGLSDLQFKELARFNKGSVGVFRRFPAFNYPHLAED